jgi:hypothetical protein
MQRCQTEPAPSPCLPLVLDRASTPFTAASAAIADTAASTHGRRHVTSTSVSLIPQIPITE